MDPLMNGLHNGTYIVVMLLSLIIYHKAKQRGWIMWGSVMAVIFTLLSFSLGEMHLDFAKDIMSLGGAEYSKMTITGFGPLGIVIALGLVILAVLKKRGGTPILRANACLMLIAGLATVSGSYWNHAFSSKPATAIAVTLQDWAVTFLYSTGDFISSISLG